jgi:hypothetical protein
MDIELQNKLFDKYPKLFRQRTLNPEDTCMCFGIECGDGWFWLLYELCDFIQTYVDNNKEEQPEAIQVKEKFGGLRFYTTPTTGKIDGAIWFAESLSMSICEVCGSREDVTQTKGWVRSLCKKCIK